MLPGTYQVRLTVDGRSYRHAVTVRMDPRVKTSLADLTRSSRCRARSTWLMRRLVAARADVAARLGRASDDAAAALATARRPICRRAYAPLPALLDALQEADVKPLPAVEAAATEAVKRAEAVLARVPAG